MRVVVRSSGSFLASSLLACALAADASAQVSYGGSPPSTWADLQVPLQVLELPELDRDALPPAGAPRRPGQPEYYGQILPIDASAEEIGAWEMLASGDLVWRVALYSHGAKSLSAIFSSFHVPPGGQLFVHGPGEERSLGAYIDLNANEDGSFAFEPLAGDEIVLEYLEPADSPFHADLRLSEAIHDYVGVFDLLAGTDPVGSSDAAQPCEVDVNCPAGSGYQAQKRAVVRLLAGGALCSGAMINNSAFNGKQYMMTAFHCGNMNNAILYFNYERPSCGSGTPPIQTVSGTTQKASSQPNDFRLVQVTPTIPASYNHYLLGWNRNTTITESTVCIHHPAGDVKKISFDNQAPSLNSGFWWIKQWDLGVTEPGSSGSPLMTASGRFIGQLYGGYSYCGYPFDDFYGRFSSAWSKVRPYLDPLGTQPTSIGGFDP